jgi:putative transposase
VADFYHVFNRGNGRKQLFFEPQGYQAFLRLLRDAPDVGSVRILAYCVMPNHWHLVVWPIHQSALSSYMRWVTGAHARHWNEVRERKGWGHVYQERFRALPIVREQHLLTVLRYVEANPVRARLVSSAADWPWSSHAQVRDESAPPLTPWPMPKPALWSSLVNERLDDEELNAIRDAGHRGVPIGTEVCRRSRRNDRVGEILFNCP